MHTQRTIHASAGQQFGRLTILDPERTIRKQSGKNYRAALVQCVCGIQKLVYLDQLVRGQVKSCGCQRADAVRARLTTHGSEPRRLYGIWCGIRNRCSIPTVKNFHRYGGRGITVCPEWRDDFATFRAWALANGYRDDLTIERINVDGHYSPENCRWATWGEQARNTRQNRIVTAFGESKCVAAWGEDPRCIVSASILYQRMTKFGRSPEEAMTTPLGVRVKQVDRDH